MTYQLVIPDEELAILKDLIRQELAGLHEELRRTEQWEYKSAMQQRLARAEHILERIQQAEQVVPVPT